MEETNVNIDYDYLEGLEESDEPGDTDEEIS